MTGLMRIDQLRRRRFIASPASARTPEASKLVVAGSGTGRKFNDAFKTLVRDLAMHVAAADPMGIDRDDIPADVVDRERSLLVEQAKATGKPEAVVEKMVTGQLDKFFGERVLTEQVFVKDPDGKKKVGDLLAETIVKIGENIKVNRFSRFQLGEE